MPEQNVIVGPDGRVFRPREVATGIASHVKLMVREWELFNLELEKMVQECRSRAEDQEKEHREQQPRGIQWLPWAFSLFETFPILPGSGRGGPGDPSTRTNPGGGD